MYHVGQPTNRYQRRRRILWSLAGAAVLLGAWGLSRLLHPATVIHQATPTTTHVAIAAAKTQSISKPTFTIQLPQDWKPATSDLMPTALYTWQGGTKTDDARRLDIYVDDIPATLAVNRMLPLQADNDKVTPTAAVSDNCVNFTAKSSANTQTGAAPAMWSGIAFLCDTANSLRDVVGTSSESGINTVAVTGPSGVKRHFFFVYTDHSAQPDYDMFTTILASFRAR